MNIRRLTRSRIGQHIGAVLCLLFVTCGFNGSNAATSGPKIPGAGAGGFVHVPHSSWSHRPPAESRASDLQTVHSHPKLPNDWPNRVRQHG
jgi:hypothetical protein